MKKKIFLFSFLIPLIFPLNICTEKYLIVWDPNNVELTLGLGDTKDLSVTFGSVTELKNANLWIVPELRPYVSVAPSHFEIIKANTPYNISLHFSVPLNTETRHYDGTVHLKVGSKTYAQTLKVELNVVNAAMTVGIKGGEILTPDGNVTISIPPGALTSDTLITIYCYPYSKLDLGQIGELIKLGPEEEIFNGPVKVIISYDLADVPNLVSENDLFLARLGEFESWETLENSQVDTTNKKVSATINHFSTIGVLYSIFTDISGFKLGFPIQYLSPFNTPISAIFDHTTKISYVPDDKVCAFTGEAAFGEKDSSGNYTNASQVLKNLYGFKNKCKTNFYVNSQYTGGGDTEFLYYDGHPGIDFDIDYLGVLAAHQGKVIYAGWENPDDHKYGLGLYIKIIDNETGFQTLYGHLSRIDVSSGDKVTKGQPIGISGNTGASTGAHLHFEARYNWVPIDPYGWGGSYPDPYKQENRYLWEIGNKIEYKDIPAQYKCDTDNDNIPDEFDAGIDNLNPSFEEGTGTWPDGWEPYYPNFAILIWSDTKAHTGTRSVSISNVTPGNVSGWMTSNFFTVDPTKEYEISVWFFQSGTPIGYAYTYVGFLEYDANGVELGGWLWAVDSHSVDDWTHFQMSYAGRLMPQTTKVRILLYCNNWSGISQNATVWFDDMKLIQK